MKRVWFQDEVDLLSAPFKEELENGDYYEIPDRLVLEMESAWEEFCRKQDAVFEYTSTHAKVVEEEDIEVAETVPILPPGVDK